MTEVLSLLGAVLLGVLSTLGVARLRRLLALRRIAAERVVLGLPAVSMAALPFNEVDLQAACLEQRRRELDLATRQSPHKRSQLRYRPDQSIQSIQQRLSRVWGKDPAFSAAAKKRIEEVWRGLDDPK